VNRCIELRVLSREGAERYEPRGVEVCISIGDPRAPPAKLSRAFAAVLRLTFNDIVAAPGDDHILFAPDHAGEILRFVAEWPDVDRIVVHCEFGVSRSPGVALGLCDYFDWPARELEGAFPGWNRLVRSVIAKNTRLPSSFSEHSSWKDNA
jgi:predicted protein tyrosine phosphatase